MSSFLKAALSILTVLARSGMSLPAADANLKVEDASPALELAPRLARPFGDNAVLQQNKPVPVWGWSSPGAEVTVTFDQQRKSALAGQDGRWQVTLDPIPADKFSSYTQNPVGCNLYNKDGLPASPFSTNGY